MKQNALLSAQTMALVVGRDQQFRMPIRPRFGREFVVIPLQDGLLIEGADERQVLRGRAAITLVPQLLAVLDGTRAFPEICEALPFVVPEHIQAALALLYTRGLLEDAEADGATEEPGIHPEALSFFRRHVDATRVNRSAVEAARRLAANHVLIVSDEVDCASRLASELRLIGLAQVRVVDPQVADAGGATLVVALSAGGNENAWMNRLDRMCMAGGVPWMRCALHGSALEVGPYFIPQAQRCYECLSLCHRLQARVPEHSPEWVREIWLQLAATELVYLLSRTITPSTVHEVRVIDTKAWTSYRQKYSRVPGCPNCLPGLPAHQPPVALTYEDMVESPPIQLTSPKDYQIHFKLENAALMQHSKRYPNAPVISLPSPAELPLPDADLLGHLLARHKPATAQPIRLHELAALLLYSAGIRDADAVDIKPRRWAFNGGNLGSPSFYVLVRRIEQLPVGLYCYLPTEHALAAIRPELDEGVVETAMRLVVALNDGDPLPAALVVATGAYGRMSQKYQTLGYALVHLDAGVALTQAQLVGQAVGLVVRRAHHWSDDGLLALLQLDGYSELITGVLGVLPSWTEGGKVHE